MSLRFINATILKNNELQDRSLSIEDGCISEGPFTAVDMGGYFILPGIIDLHGDAFERHIVSRPKAHSIFVRPCAELMLNWLPMV